MKTYIRFILVILILGAFAGISSLYLRFYVTPKAHGIILFIANAYDISLINRARLQASKKGQRLHMDRLHQVALLTTIGLNDNVADEAASATALASGELSPNGYVGYNSLGKRLNTLIYAAQKAGRLTGLITTNMLTATTPTAFYSTKRGDPNDVYRNAMELIDSSKIDLILGGGASHFLPATVKNPMGRLDRRNLIQVAERKGYEIVLTQKSLEEVPRWPPRKVLGLFASESFVYTSLAKGTMTQPSLADLTRRGIELLDLHIGGYFLVIDHGLIENAARRNLTQLALNEIAALDEAIRIAINYGGKKSIVLCTSGFSLGALDVRKNQINGFTAENENISYDWLTGPGARATSKAPKYNLSAGIFDLYQRHFRHEPLLLTPQPAIHYSSEAEVISSPSWLAVRGFGEENFHGFLNSTSIYNLILRLF
jgi:alkaline phosphatase